MTAKEHRCEYINAVKILKSIGCLEILVHLYLPSSKHLGTDTKQTHDICHEFRNEHVLLCFLNPR